LRPAGARVQPSGTVHSLLTEFYFRLHPLSLQEGKLTASEGLGDLFKGAADWDTALDVYRQAGAANKVVEALAAKGDFEQLATFTRSSGGCGQTLAFVCCFS
jgi:hypothetical protein